MSFGSGVFFRSFFTGIILLFLMSGEAVLAEAELLKLKDGKTYFHKASNIKLPAEIKGAPYKEGKSYYPGELNIGVQYFDEAQHNFLTIYIYKVSAGGAALWFEQAQESIKNRGIFDRIDPANVPVAFRFPSWRKASGLRVGYDVADSKFKSTALIVGAVNGWMVKVRASSSEMNLSELNEWVDQSLNAIKWPKESGSDPEAQSIKPCENALIFAERPQAIREDALTSSLIGVLANLNSDSSEKVAAEESEIEEPGHWCRDVAISSLGSNIYRKDATADSYLLAQNDTGVSMMTGYDGLTSFLTSKKQDEEDGGAGTPPRYYVHLNLPDERVVYAPRDGLPNPATLLDILNNERPVSAVSLTKKGSNITVYKDAFE